MEPAALKAELRLARRALAPKWLKLVGGEPLLHSRLIECLEVAHSVDIAPIVSLTTNGFLLPRQPKEFWVMLNALTISLYPQPVLPEQTIALVEARAKEYNVQLNWKRQLEAPRVVSRHALRRVAQTPRDQARDLRPYARQ